MIEAALYALLAADAGVSALVGTRIYPAVIPEGTTGDAVRYQLISDVPYPVMGQNSGLAKARIQVEAQAATYAAAATLRDALRTALTRFRGATGGVTVQDVFRESGLALYDDTAQRYVLTDDYLLMYLEA